MTAFDECSAMIAACLWCCGWGQGALMGVVNTLTLNQRLRSSGALHFDLPLKRQVKR
jgi:hypothetical protein